MRSVVVDSVGGPERLVLENVAKPTPGQGEVLIDVAYAGANWSDIEKREGTYPDPVSYPAIIGLEVSGRVSAVGPDVGTVATGDRVAAITGPSMLGGYSEQCVVGAEYVIHVPDALPLDRAAAFPVVTLTAYHLLFNAHRVRKGERILVHAIGGGLGLMLTQIAVAHGAIVIGTVGHPGKERRAVGYGAALVINRTERDFVQAVNDYTHGRGVDLVIDSLGGSILSNSFDCVRTYGAVINIGEASGYPEFDIRTKLYERSTSLAGFELLHAGPGSVRWRRGVHYVLERVVDGRLEAPIEGCYPLSAVQEMHRRLESRQVSGKLLLEVNPAMA